MNNEELIKEAREEFLRHSNDVWVTDLVERLADALEAATSTGYDYTGADYDGSPDRVGWRQWGNFDPDIARWRRRSAGDWEPYRDWKGDLVSE